MIREIGKEPETTNERTELVVHRGDKGFMPVTPAKAGVQPSVHSWIPAFAGMTPHPSSPSFSVSVANLCLRADPLLPKPALIAIVDDDRLVRRSIARLLKSVGFKVEMFASAEDFLLHGNLHDTACLVLDVRLPGMSGLDLQRRLAAHHHLPIIFVSAHDEQKTREQALQTGAVAFLNKPFSEEALLSDVRSALKSPH